MPDSAKTRVPTEYGSSQRVNRDWAKHEYELYKHHGRPSRPYYLKCLRCEEAWEVSGTLYAADHDSRWHAGEHGGLKDEHAQVVVTDATGRELWRHHAIHTPQEKPEECPQCGERPHEAHATCPNCGWIPEDARA